MFIGQADIINKVANWTWQDVPRTWLFVGQLGCGKHTLATMIANKIGVDFVQVPQDVTAEDLTEYTQCVLNKIYFIDLTLFTEAEQNKFLKFIEEPSSTAKVILSAVNESLVLNTVLNRCAIYKFVPYSINQLKQCKCFQDETVYSLCTTPGQLMTVDAGKLSQLLAFANKLITFIGTASYANTLSIYTKINYDELYDKFDFNLFLRVMCWLSYNRFINGQNKCWDIYCVAIEYFNKLVGRTVNKEHFMLNYLTAVWQKANE